MHEFYFHNFLKNNCFDANGFSYDDQPNYNNKQCINSTKWEFSHEVREKIDKEALFLRTLVSKKMQQKLLTSGAQKISFVGNINMV